MEDDKMAFSRYLLYLAIVLGLGFFLLAGGIRGSIAENSSGSKKTNEVKVLSDNDVRIFSPETNIYYDSNNQDTSVTGERNVVAPTQSQCWVSSANDWGPCPAGAPAGSAVP